MSLVVLLALILEMVVLGRIEARLIGTRVTPFNALGLPYVVVAVTAFFVAPTLEFVPLSSGSLIVWMCGLFLVWMLGMFVTQCFGGPQLRNCVSGLAKSQFPTENSSARVARWVAIAALPILAYGVIHSLQIVGGWSEIASPGFKAVHHSGFPAHITVLCTPIFIVLIGTASRKDRLNLFLAALLMAFLLIGQVKGNVLQPLIGGLFYRVMRGRTAISFKTVAVVFLCGVLVFTAVNLFAWWVADPSTISSIDTYSFIARYFSFYLFAGPLAFSEAIRTDTRDVGGSPESIYAPFLNIYGVITGSEMIPQVSDKGRGVGIDLLDDRLEHNPNVYTFFGTLYLYLGGIGACLYVMGVFFLCYLLFAVAVTAKSEWLLVLYCFVGAQLSCGFFEFYFWHLTTLEVTAYMLCFAAGAVLLRKGNGRSVTMPRLGNAGSEAPLGHATRVK